MIEFAFRPNGSAVGEHDVLGDGKTETRCRPRDKRCLMPECFGHLFRFGIRKVSNKKIGISIKRLHRKRSRNRLLRASHS